MPALAKQPADEEHGSEGFVNAAGALNFEGAQRWEFWKYHLQKLGNPGSNSLSTSQH